MHGRWKIHTIIPNVVIDDFYNTVGSMPIDHEVIMDINMYFILKDVKPRVMLTYDIFTSESIKPYSGNTPSHIKQ